MFTIELSEMIDEIREIEIYGNDPQDWRGYLESDDYWETNVELVY